MYEAFYGLHEAPFRLTPDPRYLYLSAQHREALGHLLFGIEHGGGFVAVTGEIGTGKTTLLRTILRDLEASTVVGYIFNPALSDLELLQTINSELSLPAASSSKRELVDELNRFLLAQKLAGRRVVIIVDEAQNLAPSTIEQLRLLSNLETETEKLLQIVLVGQPELRVMLKRPELAQLNQRITVRWHLHPLDRASTTRYVQHRLAVAGGAGATTLLSSAALRVVYRFSHGVPRLINIICHRALLVGYTREQRTLGTRIVRQAIAELQQPEAPTQSGRWALWPAVSTALGALVLGIVAAAAVVTPRGILGPGEVSPPADPSASERPAPADVPPEAAASDSGHAMGDTVAVRRLGDVAAMPVAAPTDAPNAVDAATRFWGALAALDHREAARRATQDMLAEWTAKPLQADEDAGAQLDLQTIAGRRNLEYLATDGTLARLALLNLPAILEISLPASGLRRFVVLTGLDADHTEVTLGLGADRVTIAASELHRVWFGEARLFWRDFEALPPTLAPGRSGGDVLRLQRLLARSGHFGTPPTQTFDDATVEAIARFQRSHRLVADGIVGPLTKIVLYDAVASYDHPRLNDGT